MTGPVPVSASRTTWWLLGVAAVIVCLLPVLYFLLQRNTLSADQTHAETAQEEIPVTVVCPKYGAFERITVQPGSVQAFQSVQILSQVSGFLKEQPVDIGATVKKGDVLAVLAVPDLEKVVQQHAATLKLTKAKVNQMKARIKTARAEVEAKKAGVIQAEAASKSAAAWTRFRGKQVERWKALSLRGSISEKMVDESREQFAAAKETQRAAEAAIPAARAQQMAAEALVEQAEADVAEVEAEVEVARATLEKSQVMLSFATIHAPFDGVISQRNLSPGDFVRAATDGGSKPLFSLESMDVFRVVVQIPDRDVPYADAEDTAYVEIDAFPGKRFPVKISRIAKSEDPQTRLMHVELDLKNEDHKLVQGMYGRVTIVLDKAAHSLSLPSTCLHAKTQDGKAQVFVVRKGKSDADKAVLTPVRWGMDNGIHVEILEGLQVDDRVVDQPPLDLISGAHVLVVPDHEHQ